METSIAELLTYYVIGGALLIGAPAVFFLIAGVQNTKGRMVGYKDLLMFYAGDNTKHFKTHEGSYGRIQRP